MTNVMADGTDRPGRRPGQAQAAWRVRARAAIPLLGLWEFQHEYDDLQVKDQAPAAGVHREFRYRALIGMDDHGTRSCWRNPYFQQPEHKTARRVRSDAK